MLRWHIIIKNHEIEKERKLHRYIANIRFSPIVWKILLSHFAYLVCLFVYHSTSRRRTHTHTYTVHSMIGSQCHQFGIRVVCHAEARAQFLLFAIYYMTFSEYCIYRYTTYFCRLLRLARAFPPSPDSLFPGVPNIGRVAIFLHWNLIKIYNETHLSYILLHIQSVGKLLLLWAADISNFFSCFFFHSSFGFWYEYKNVEQR